MAYHSEATEITVCIRRSLKISTFEDRTLNSSPKGLLGSNSPDTASYDVVHLFPPLFSLPRCGLSFGHNSSTFLTAAEVYLVHIQVIGLDLREQERYWQYGHED